MQDGKFISNTSDIVNILQRQYQSVFTQPPDSEHIENIIQFSYEGTNDPTKKYLLDLEVNEELVTEVIEKMPGNSAAGGDSIPSSTLKLAKSGLATPLSSLFRNALDQHKPLEDQYETIVIPIPKANKKKSDPASYRPIALCSQIIEILERMIVDKIVEHLNEAGMEDTAQYGFTKGKSAEQQLLRYLAHIIAQIESGCIDSVYLDYQKAFDVVCHDHLLRKLKNQFNIGGKILVFIAGFLKNRYQTVVLDCHKSHNAKVCS